MPNISLVFLLFYISYIFPVFSVIVFGGLLPPNYISPPEHFLLEFIRFESVYV
ncbi:hypothetical protein ACOSP7_000747 [Xanthoceras sorbifolium]